jgi:hypothetical protein
MAFVVKGRTEALTAFELVNDDGDINIEVNGKELAYFDGKSGKLFLWHCTPEERKAMAGLAFDARGRLAIAE